MIAILEKYEHNIDFHQIVDFVEASYLRIETTDEGTKILATVDGKPRTISESSIRRNLKLRDEVGSSSLPDAELFENLTLMRVNSPSFSGRTVPLFPTMLVTMGEGSGTPTEPHHTPSPEAPQSPQHDLSSSIHPPVPTATIPTVIPTDNPLLMQYFRRARIAQSSALPTIADEPASPLRDAVKQAKMVSKITAQDLEISTLKVRIKLLEDRDGGGDDSSGEDATIKGRNLETTEESGIKRSTDKGSNDTEEIVNVLTSLDVASILTSRVQVSVPPAAEVPTVSISPAGEIPTGSGMVPTASPIFTTATVATPYSRKKGKEKVVESETPKKKKLQEQMDVQMARQLEEEMARDAQRMNEQIARDAEIARIHAEEELQILIDGLDSNNETIKDFVPIGSKEEGERFKRKGLRLEQDSAKKVKTSKEVSEEDLKIMMQLVPVEEVYVEALQHFNREDLNQIWALVKETLNITQATSDKEKELWVELKRLYGPDVEDQLWTHTQALIHDPVEWRLCDSCGVHHVLSGDQEIFMLVERDYPLRKPSDEFPLPEDFPTASKERFPLLRKRDATAEEVCTANEDKEEGERFKRKGLRLEQDSAKKVKTSEEISEEDHKTMMQLVPVEEALVKETLNIIQATSYKEKELLVELKRLHEPDVEDQLWTHTQTLIHDPVEWRLYDSCGVHHVLSGDQEIFILVERDYPLRNVQDKEVIEGILSSDKFPLPEYFPTASEERFPLLRKRDVTAEEVCTANEDKGSRSNLENNMISHRNNFRNSTNLGFDYIWNTPLFERLGMVAVELDG
uniref:Uncharacterized protein n=1 Tax=Tanacetum cinerariifolium TaxID=118510 RepID=A0A6L2PC44_TANCI|nr:hypothetical protein [Tanacetum cinerariifolium]